MARHIDRFIAAMRRDDAEELIFVTGEPVRVRHGEQVRVVLAQPVRSDQILAIAGEFAPAGLAAIRSRRRGRQKPQGRKGRKGGGLSLIHISEPTRPY